MTAAKLASQTSPVRHHRRGFALPTILISSVVMLIVLLVSVTSTTAVRTAIKNQYYSQLSQVAGEAGVAYAQSCLAANNGFAQWTDSLPLKSNTNCAGVETLPCPTTAVNALCSVMRNGSIRSNFMIGAPTLDSNGKVASIPSGGYVELIRTSDSGVWRRYEQRSVNEAVAVAPGLSLSCPTGPSGYVVVPGSSTYGTSDFCVMKYEAKNVTGVATSAASGLPWSTTQTLASSTANAACGGCHLITEAEWLTIAQNVLSVPSNWSGGSVGIGYVYSGHGDASPGNNLAASIDDNDGYSGTGNSYNSSQRRTLTLTNGSVIWDLSGNVWEWTAGTITTGKAGSPGCCIWREWNALAVPSGTASPNPNPVFGTPAASAWTSINGIGTIDSDSNSATLSGYVRGGYYNQGSGVYMLYYNPPGSSAGFRATHP